ncbi:MAG: hypothetical protein JNK38_26915 [Acidobacteria bacterium]|nr:hypothetical protein [Acidobacteriota bacterium]
MRKLGFNLLVVLTLCVGLMGTALANGKNLKKTVTLDKDVLVNGTLVKKGTYQIKFDASQSLLMIENGKDAVATAKVNVKQASKKAQYNSLGYTSTEKGELLTTVTFSGDNRVLHLGELQTTSSDE